MKSVRVLVANRPRLIRELVMATIAEQPDIEIVGEIQEESDVERAVDEIRPDCLIVALERHDELPHFCEAILEKHPRMKIIGIASDRNSSMFYWASLSVQSNEIEASETGVLNALRGILHPNLRVQ